MRKLVLALSLLTAVVACGKPDPKAQEEAMVREAQRIAAEEQEFQRDSAKLAATFELKRVTATNTMSVRAEDDEGNVYDEPHFYVISDDKKVCQVTKEKYNAFKSATVPDTLTCQWVDKYEN